MRLSCFLCCLSCLQASFLPPGRQLPALSARHLARRVASPPLLSATKRGPIPYGELTVGVAAEDAPRERRVVQDPKSVKLLVDAGFEVRVEAGAGAEALFSDEAYVEAGASIVKAKAVWASDIVLKIRPPSVAQLELLGDRTLISLVNPSANVHLLERLQEQGATAFSLDCIPRMLSRGQTFDVLSSQTNIAGYRAVVEASHAFGRFFAGQTTAAGKVAPAKVLVLGAGVAGLAAIQTAKNMGAIVRACRRRALSHRGSAKWTRTWHVAGTTCARPSRSRWRVSAVSS
jgi:NAD(P) transhydrogenase